MALWFFLHLELLWLQLLCDLHYLPVRILQPPCPLWFLQFMCPPLLRIYMSYIVILAIEMVFEHVDGWIKGVLKHGFVFLGFVGHLSELVYFFCSASRLALVSLWWSNSLACWAVRWVMTFSYMDTALAWWWKPNVDKFYWYWDLLMNFGALEKCILKLTQVLSSGALSCHLWIPLENICAFVIVMRPCRWVGL